jgi:hypothetical protein
MSRKKIRTAELTGAGTDIFGAKIDAIPPAQRNSLGAGLACSMSGLVEMTPAKEVIVA